MLGLGVIELLVLAIAALAVLWSFYRIFAKAGYSGWLCLAMVAPGLNLIMLLFLAFSDWPALRGGTHR